MRSSNLLPVNANGEVRLRSVVSFGKCGITCTPIFICIFSRRAVGGAGVDRIQNGGEFFAEEDGDDGRRGFVRPEAVVISRTRYRNAQQVLIIVHRLDHRAEEEKELRVLE